MKKLLLGTAGAALLGAAFLLTRTTPVEPAVSEAHDAVAQVASAPAAPSRAAGRGPASVASGLADQPLAENEKEAVKTYLNVLANYREIGNAKALAAELARANLKPVVARDANKDTGELAMVRTDNTLPGTRYFHAQVFEDGKGAAHMQHLSFEIRPGKDSMDVATSAIRQTFRDLGQPLIQKDDYVLWRNRDGRVVSAKRLGPDDLKDNYFNAHSPEDVGTIWVVSEDDPEEGDEH